MITPAGEHYEARIRFKKIPEDIEFFISPLVGMQQERLAGITVLKGLRLEQLSEFYRVSARVGDAEVQRLIKVSTEGIPRERDKAIFKTVIRDRQTFMQYIAFLLSDSLLITSLEQFDLERLGKGKWDIGLETPVYENMLKTLAREPERLQEIERVLRLVDDPDIIPEGFYGLYETFKQAARKVKR